jgi:hypothetical protein
MNAVKPDALTRAVDAQTASSALPPARRRGVRLTLLRLARAHRPATAADLVALAVSQASTGTREGREMLALEAGFPEELHTWAGQMLAYAGRSRA